MSRLVGLFLLTVLTQVFAETDPNIKVEYKKYQAIDLGDLQIKGKIIAPGDISIQERSRRTFTRRPFERPDFDPECREDILNLR